jgi:hypothetical protein
VLILGEFLEFKAFAADIKRCERTIERWTAQPDGLPYIRAGSLRLIHIPTARKWLLNRMKQRNPRRDSKAARLGASNPHGIHKKGRALLKEGPA